MKNFTFQNPVKIIFGKNTIPQLAVEVPQGARTLIIYGGGSIKRNGVYDQVFEALKGRAIFEFPGISANPDFETCLKVIDLIKKENIDFLLAIGGGSVIDATKFIALASKADGDLWEILTKNKYPEKALPFGTVLTLPATGSEMNSGAVITKAETKEKRAFGTPLVYPKFSILDPETTYTLPTEQIANGVIDTFVHTTEQYLTYPVGGALQDYFAEGILKVLVKNAEQAMKAPENYEVRANLMWASTWGLNGWIAQGVPEDWATHMIGHELTAFYGIDHAQTLAIIAPSHYRYNIESKKEKLAQYAERVWGVTNGTIEEKAKVGIDKTEEFFHSVGIKTKLSEYTAEFAGTAEIVSKRFTDRGWMGLGEHQKLAPADAAKIVEMSY